MELLSLGGTIVQAERFYQWRNLENRSQKLSRPILIGIPLWHWLEYKKIKEVFP